jgi:hypothetical protein
MNSANGYPYQSKKNRSPLNNPCQLWLVRYKQARTSQDKYIANPWSHAISGQAGGEVEKLFVIENQEFARVQDFRENGRCCFGCKQGSLGSINILAGHTEDADDIYAILMNAFGGGMTDRMGEGYSLDLMHVDFLVGCTQPAEIEKLQTNFLEVF